MAVQEAGVSYFNRLVFASGVEPVQQVGVCQSTKQVFASSADRCLMFFCFPVDLFKWCCLYCPTAALRWCWCSVFPGIVLKCFRCPVFPGAVLKWWRCSIFRGVVLRWCRRCPLFSGAVLRWCRCFVFPGAVLKWRCRSNSVFWCMVWKWCCVFAVRFFEVMSLFCISRCCSYVKMSIQFCGCIQLFFFFF